MPIINRCGGGSGIASAFAVIRATFPVGYSCTCSDGTTTLTAPDTSGVYLFSVPNAGTWTVTATNGTDTRTKTLTVSARYQALNADLASLYLYDKGDECVSVTGGWQSTALNYHGGAGGTALTTEAITDGVRLTGHGGKGGIYQTVDRIDLTGYNSIKMLGNIHGNGNNPIGLYIKSAIETPFDTGTAASYEAPSTEQDNYFDNEEIIDISSLTGSYFIYFGIASTDSKFIELKQLYLE